MYRQTDGWRQTDRYIDKKTKRERSNTAASIGFQSCND